MSCKNYPNPKFALKNFLNFVKKILQ